MKAAVLYGKEDVRVEEIAPAELKPGEVRIQIKAALTCGTDLKVFKRGYHARMIVPPAVFGHELAGVISEVSAGARPEVPDSAHPRTWQVGDRVVVANSAPCGTCFYCRRNQDHLCDDLLFLNGAYAESIVVPARLVSKNLLHLQDQTPFHEAALVEPLACVVQGIEESKLEPQDRVLVLGSGPIGLMFVALAKHAGCRVTLAGRGAKRIQTARTLGAEVVDVTGQSDLCKALTPNPGFDVVIEAVGKPETWEAAVRLVRKGGKVNFFGGCPSGSTVTLDTGLIHYSNLTLLASFHHSPRAIRNALGLIESRVVRSENFIDGHWPLSDLPKLFRSMAEGNHAVKTLIDVSG